MSNELQVLENNSNAIIEAYKSDGGVQSLFDQIAEQARSIVPDLTTDKGRKAIASMARKVASTKTAFDAHGKELKEQYTVITSKIDADRKLFRDQCDALRDEIRKPLTDWENAEKQRILDLLNRVEALKAQPELNTSIEIENDIKRISAIIVDDSFLEYKERAKLQKYETLDFLSNLLAETKGREAEQERIEAEKIAEQERLQRERDEQIAKQAAEKVQREAEEKARLEADRVQREKLEAEQREARLKAEKEAAELREQQLKKQAIEHEKQAEIDRQNAIKAERLRIENQRKAEIEHQEKLEAQRKANIEHMRQINNDVLQSLLEVGLDDEQAKKVITAIAKNQVPHVSIKY